MNKKQKQVLDLILQAARKTLNNKSFVADVNRTFQALQNSDFNRKNYGEDDAYFDALEIEIGMGDTVFGAVCQVYSSPTMDKADKVYCSIESSFKSEIVPLVKAKIDEYLNNRNND